MALVRTTHDGPVRILTVDRPPRNAVDLTLVTALGEAIEAAAGDDACRALVLTGAPPAFSAGIDVKVVPGYDRAARAVSHRERRLASQPLTRAVAAPVGSQKSNAPEFVCMDSVRMIGRTPLARRF